jgi:hypothetical protein
MEHTALMLERVLSEYLMKDPTDGPICPLTLQQARQAVAAAREQQDTNKRALAALEELTRCVDQYMTGALVSIPTAIRFNAAEIIAKAKGTA